MYVLQIKSDNDELVKLYSNHGTFHDGDSGLDLFNPNELNINYPERTRVDLEIKTCLIQIDPLTGNHKPSSWRLVPRSSIVKTPLILSNSEGIIDAGYRGNICAFVDHIKPNEDTFVIEKHSRLFQLVTPDMKPIAKIEFVEKFDFSTRGENGFGSTSN
jgi:dUTP pyrophosphatase